MTHGPERFDVTLAGEFNLDLMLYGLPETLPAERELLAKRAETMLGGSPAITAHNSTTATGGVTAFQSRTPCSNFWQNMCCR
ncbi:hypothetical protein [Acidobacterium sp. S8]|uniref:hypothetical protein n=1 Tax=Acidobacterium sp. S8 TaxID=1641854 RepID=UPI00131BD428|nr:hypothetical protein [Acidobacterium sp. S8]